MYYSFRIFSYSQSVYQSLVYIIVIEFKGDNDESVLKGSVAFLQFLIFIWCDAFSVIDSTPKIHVYKFK